MLIKWDSISSESTLSIFAVDEMFYHAIHVEKIEQIP